MEFQKSVADQGAAQKLFAAILNIPHGFCEKAALSSRP